MAGGRPGPALFELLKDRTGTTGASQQQASSVPVAPPSVRPEHVVNLPPVAPVRPMPVVHTVVPPPPPAPRPVAVPAQDETTDETPPPGHRPKPWVIQREGAAAALGRSVTVSTSVLWLALAGVLVSWIVVWTAAWKISENHEAEKANRQFGLTAGIHDPLKGNEPIPVNPGLLAQDQGTPKPPPQNVEPKRQAPTQGAPPAPAAMGEARVPSLNYLILATKVDPETASRMVEFLGKNGVQAAASPVAKGEAGGNNAGLFTVYALRGITGEQLRAKAPEKTELEEAVHRLGKVWQKEHKGQTDFATSWWKKYGS